ncbi:MAG: hypothetical protein CVV27_08855, partial [Candidatus Melainabacteria bacterium HGW-Melainabacteria-1]
MSKEPHTWLDEHRDQQVLFKAYLDCLLLDREQLDHILRDQQSFEHARMTAIKLLEHLQLHPLIAHLQPPAEPEQLSPYQLAVHLDYVQRELAVLASSGTEFELFGSLQQELSYLLPR